VFGFGAHVGGKNYLLSVIHCGEIGVLFYVFGVVHYIYIHGKRIGMSHLVFIAVVAVDFVNVCVLLW
jgi:hypothetical protein